MLELLIVVVRADRRASTGSWIKGQKAERAFIALIGSAEANVAFRARPSELIHYRTARRHETPGRRRPARFDPLEDQFQRQLNLTRAVGLTADDAEVAGVDLRPGRIELHAVERVEELHAELGVEFSLVEVVVLEE